MSSLEPFRKQAKQLVRWHRDRNYSIGGRIRGLERYRQLTDAEVMKMRFPLAIAQEIVAREAGFESWVELKAAVESEPPTPTRRPLAERATLKAAIPVIFVASVARSADFFRDQLGFVIDFLHGNPAFYAGVSRDGIVLHLRFVHEPVLTEELREKEGLLAAFIRVENVKALFEEYKSKDVRLVATLRKEPWGGPSFTVADPDGNRICFCAL